VGGCFWGLRCGGYFWIGFVLGGFFGGGKMGRNWCCVGLYGAFLRLGIWYRRDSRVGQEGIDWLASLYVN
jgi:hypothetical protein